MKSSQHNYELPPKLVATQKGKELYRGEPVLQRAVHEFLANDYWRKDTGLNFVGQGAQALVMSTGSVALKLSTRSTGSRGYEDPNNKRPENLVLQHDFMLALYKYLRNGDGSVTAPEPYFAISSEKTDSSMRAEELMKGWRSLDEARINNKLTDEQYYNLLELVKKKILLAMGRNVLLKAGLTDLGLAKGKTLHGHNVLIPEDSGLKPDKICIIDQPNRIILPKTALKINSILARILPKD